MNDLISRQAAIDRINKQREHLQPDIYPQDKIGDAAYRICAEFIERLPSAQPKPCEDAVSREDVLEVNFLMPESELVFYDNDHGFCINTQDVLEHIERYVQQELNDE